MDRKKQIAALTDDEGERLLLAQACERLTRAEQRGIPAATVFLTPREQALLRQLLPQCRFWGGTPDAERAVAYWLPEYEDEDDYRENGPVACLRAAFFEENAVGHRDMLGALMGCGIKRETVGDICVGKGSCDFFLLREMAPYVVQNLPSAGRTRLHLEEIPLEEAQIPTPETETIRGTLASCRLDSVIGAGFRLSRTRAGELVLSGGAAVDGLPCQKPDRQVAPGAVISLRGMGKIRLAEVKGQTRKGRISVEIEKFK